MAPLNLARDEAKERETLFQLQLQPYLEKAKQTFPDIQKRAEHAQLRAQTTTSPEDKRFFEVLAESYNDEKIARLHWYSDTEEFYENYKKSLLWKQIRKSVIRRDNYQCQGCGQRTYAGRKRVYDLYAFEVHHTDYKYETMAGVDDSGLVTLCRSCHKHIHFNKNGEKRSDAEWGDILQRLKEYHARKQREKRKTTRLINQLRRLKRQ